MILTSKQKKKWSLTTKILFGMILGLIVGLVIKLLPYSCFINTYFVNGLFDIGGHIFIALLEMLVVPIVFVSLVCGTCSLGDLKQLGRMGIKTLIIFLLTMAIAVTMGIFFANLFQIGHSTHLTVSSSFHAAAAPSIKQMIIGLVPINPINAMTKGNLLQIIVFALFVGMAIAVSGTAGKNIAKLFNDINHILMKLILMIMQLAPYGVFFLIAEVVAKTGFSILNDLLVYFLTIALVIIIQMFGLYSILLVILARLNPIIFFKKVYAIILFAFSTSSSNATIPINLETTEHQLGVNPSVASFVIPLGATIHMDGTAIMQGVATVFIAHIYHVHLSLTTYMMVILTTTLASIGTAGVPGVGIITLAMVLTQAGLPLSGVGLIIGIDRLIDMCRTVINVVGDTMTACIVNKNEKIK